MTTRDRFSPHCAIVALFIAQVHQPYALSEIDLDLVSAQRTIEELKFTGEKPQLSEKALTRMRGRNRHDSPSHTSNATYSPPLGTIYASSPTGASGMSQSLEKIPSSMNSLAHSLPHSLPPSFPHSLDPSLPPSLPPSLTPSIPPSLTPSFPHSLDPSLLTPSLTHSSLTHSLTHSLTPSLPPSLSFPH